MRPRLRHPDRTFIAVWRFEGDARVRVPVRAGGKAEILYPRDADIRFAADGDAVSLDFPLLYMPAVVRLR